MFNKALDFTVKHDMFGAFIFFLTHLILMTGISTVVVHILSMTGFIDGTVGTFFEGGEIYTLVGTLFVMWLGGTILTKKGLTSDIMSIIVVGVGLYLSWTTGVILGLVPIALLTTMGK